MDFEQSADHFVGTARVGSGAPKKAPVPVKIIVAGGFGVGKTTTVGAISEISPLTTEAEMTSESVGIDNPGHGSMKTTTTIAAPSSNARSTTPSITTPSRVIVTGVSR